MSRTLTLLIALLIALTAFLMVRTLNKDKTPEHIQGASTPFIADPNFETWREYVSSSGNFKAIFPTIPQHISDKIVDEETGELRKYETFVSGDERGAAFMISAITTPEKGDKTPDADELKAVVADMLKRNKDNKLNSMTPTTFHNAPAIDFSITSGGLLIVGKVFAESNTVYVLSMINNADFFNPKVFDFFTKSFAIEAAPKSEKNELKK